MVLALEPVLVLAIAPLLLFPWRWPLAAAAACGALVLIWGVRWTVLRRLAQPTGFEAPLVYVLLATGIAMLPVFDWRAALPRVLGIVTGIALLYAIADAVRAPRRLWIATAGFVLAGTGIALVGLVGTEWPTSKFLWFDLAYQRLPRLIGGIVEDSERGGFQPNQLAAVLLFPLFVGAGLLGSRWRLGRGQSAMRLALGFGVITMLGVLGLTQSRSAYAGLAIGMLFLASSPLVAGVMRRAQPAHVVAVLSGVGLVLLTGLVALAVGGQGPSWLIGSAEQVRTRVQVWDLSLRVLQDHALTGVGIGQLNVVVHAVYDPKLFVSPPYTWIPHAHNLFLQTALDFGVPGAVAAGLVGYAFFRNCRRLLLSERPELRGLGLGLTAAMLAYLVFGLTDTINPGARAGLIIWATLGIAAAGGRIARRCPGQ